MTSVTVRVCCGKGWGADSLAFSKTSMINILDLGIIFNILENVNIKIYDNFSPESNSNAVRGCLT